MMGEMRVAREVRQTFTWTVGKGSNWQVDGLHLRMRSEISEAVRSWNTENEWEVSWNSNESLREEFGPRCWWILWIFSLKNAVKNSPTCTPLSTCGGGEGGGVESLKVKEHCWVVRIMRLRCWFCEWYDHFFCRASWADDFWLSLAELQGWPKYVIFFLFSIFLLD